MGFGHKIFAAVSIATSLSASVYAAENRGTVEIFFVPIGIETFSAVTKSNIEEGCIGYARVTPDNDRLRQSLRVIARATKTELEINEHQIRLKIKFASDKITYIDNDGVTETRAGDHRLIKVDTDQINHLVAKLTDTKFGSFKDTFNTLTRPRSSDYKCRANTK